MAVSEMGLELRGYAFSRFLGIRGVIATFHEDGVTPNVEQSVNRDVRCLGKCEVIKSLRSLMCTPSIPGLFELG